MLEHQDPLSGLLAAVADPTRRAMVERLAQKPHSVSELAEPFAMSLAAVVQHVNVLEACGAVISEKQGRVRTCRVNMAALSQIGAWVHERQRFWQEQFDNLETLLDSLPAGVNPKTRGAKS